MPKRGQVIVDDYLRRIVSGELSEGQLLPTETAMIDNYGVSRTAVREAVQTLAHKGFVRIRQGSGSTVAPRAGWNVLDDDYLAVTGLGANLDASILEAQDLLEPAIAALAATNATDEQIDELRRIIGELADATDSLRIQTLDGAAHDQLAACSNNPVLASMHASTVRLQARQVGDGAGRVGEKAAFWQQQVLDAVAAKDPDSAHDAMRMHLRHSHHA
jgi:DNA-binding FadR family transcriptional regulator